MTVRGPTIKFSNGHEMPLVGLGTWLSKPGEVGAAVECAINCGYRLIDTACAYQNEKEIGDALQKFFKSGKLKREDIFITTKLFPTDFRPEKVEGALRESLKKLQVDYVDLYLMHLPTAYKEFNFQTGKMVADEEVKIEDTWKGMEGVYAKGLTKGIGVSNFSQQQMERILKIAKTPIHNLQVECHIFFPQLELHEFCKKHQITFTAYGPLGSPGRKSAPGSEDYKWEEVGNPLEDEKVKNLASKYHKTSAQILLRYLLQRNISPIPKSVNENRIKENWDIFDFQLTDAEVKELSSFKPHRMFTMAFIADHPEYPFKDSLKK